MSNGNIFHCAKYHTCGVFSFSVSCILTCGMRRFGFIKNKDIMRKVQSLGIRKYKKQAATDWQPVFVSAFYIGTSCIGCIWFYWYHLNFGFLPLRPLL